FRWIQHFPLCSEPNLSFNVDLLSVPQRAAYSASGCCSPIWVRLKKQRQKSNDKRRRHRAELSILARSSATLLRHCPFAERTEGSRGSFGHRGQIPRAG